MVEERLELKARGGQRFRCRAIVARFGSKRGHVPTLLLKDITDIATGTLLADHLWFTAGRWSAILRPGDLFDFDARATRYVKGYQGRRTVLEAPVVIAWRLERPTHVAFIKNLLPRPNGDPLSCTSSSRFTSNQAPSLEGRVGGPVSQSSMTS